MNDSWSSEESPTTRPDPAPAAAETDAAPAVAGSARRADRHGEGELAEHPAWRERYPWVGLVFLVAGLATGGIGLAMIAMDLDAPGVRDVAPERWWLVVGGGVAIAWSAPWFLRPRGRRRMGIVVLGCTAVVLVVAAVAIGNVGD